MIQLMKEYKPDDTMAKMEMEKGLNSLSAKSVLVGEKLVATYAIST